MRWLVLLVVCRLGVCGLAAADWSGYADETTRNELIFACGFEVGEAVPVRESCYRIAAHDGINGGGALALTRTDLVDYRFESIPLPPLEAGCVYRLRLAVRAEVTELESGALEFAGIEFRRDGHYDSGSYFLEAVGTDSFSVHTKEFTPPADTAAFLTLYLDRRTTGTVWFDQVEIERVGTNYPAVLTWPAGLTVRPGDRQFRFQTDALAPEGLTALVTVRQEGMVPVEQWVALDARRRIAGTWPETLRPGNLEVEVTLVDSGAKRKLGFSRYELTVAASADLPDHACVIDADGRALIDGVPFLPIGVFGVPSTEADMARVAAAGFNCVMNYDILWNWGQDNDADQVMATLDRLNRNGLKLIFSLKDQLPDSNPAWSVTEWDGVHGALAVTDKVVRTFKDHPALLAWYVSDEVIRMKVPEIAALRRTVSAADPNHPTWTLTCHYNDLPYYGISGDVIGVDPYPISHTGGDRQRIDEIITAMQAGNSTGLPVWMVPQMFNWGRHKEGQWDEETWRRSRAPNGEELRAMPLLGAIYGARGFIFFAYLDWVYGNEAAMPGSSAAAWELILPVTGLLNELAPFLLSTCSAPAVTVEGGGGAVHARAFVDEQQRLRVLIVGVGAPVKAIIQVDDGRVLDSRFGKTRSLGGGRYEFTADAVESDVLFDR